MLLALVAVTAIAVAVGARRRALQLERGVEEARELFELANDPLIVADIWRVIGEIRASGIATLIVDRDYRRVLAQSDQALVLQKGLVVLAGPSARLRDSEQLASFLGV